MNDNTEALPPLPEPQTIITDADVGSRAYTAWQVRDYARAALAQRQQVPTTAWLVEWRFNGVQWLYLWPSAPGGFSFTADPNSALRFARREDAEACLAWAREVDRRRGAGVAGGELLVTDHEWNASASPQAPAQPCSAIVACGCRSTNECEYVKRHAAPASPQASLPCGQCRKADSWGIPLSKTCVYDCKFEPLNATHK